ncbi:hypothetical protein EEDFHM_03842 [Methylorubrum populi]
MRLVTTAVLALCALSSLDIAAVAQGSTGAPAGSPGATAPGGTEGRAAILNEREAIRSGDAVTTAPGLGLPAETAPPPADARKVPPSSLPRP